MAEMRAAGVITQPTNPVRSPQVQQRASAKPVSPIARTRRQHRAVNPPSQTNDSDKVIGLVLAEDKAFKCSEPECKASHFGRVADLRRHHNQKHGLRQAQAFCRYSGCNRSPVGPNGAKGKSFGARKDKRDEHERNVHQKKAQKEQEPDISYSSGASPTESF